MREIKFRAWVPKDKPHYGEKFGMFYGVEKAYDTLGSMLDGNGNEREYSWSSFEEVLQEQKEGSLFLSQFTGIKDKNGVEIYEDDILKGIGFDGKLRIWKAVALDYFHHWQETLDLIDEGNEIEVIGNIYENPELLK